MVATVIDLRPDPRISNQRPAWLADDQRWRDQLQAMDDTDWRWIEKHWDMADGKAPAVDTSWVTTGEIGGGSWRDVVEVVQVVAFLALVATGLALGWWVALR